MNQEHDNLFSNYELTSGFGLALKKGVVYNKFDKVVQVYRDKRRQEAREKQMAGQN